MSDELPAKPNNYECGVVNFDVSKNIGTHWICYIKDHSKSFVFDSFAEVPPKRLVSYLKGTEIYYRKNRNVQHFDEVTCGHLCVTVLKMYNDGYPFEDILSLLNANGHIWKYYIKL
jgi:hypothetical protein